LDKFPDSALATAKLFFKDNQTEDFMTEVMPTNERIAVVSNILLRLTTNA
jgi:hypothetical protein